jgi:hypothetical protein
VPASNGTPIADALARARQQYQNRLITIGIGVLDQLLNRHGLEDLREGSWNTATKSVTLPLARRQVAPDHPVTHLLGEGVPKGRVDATLPRAAPIFGIAADAVLRIKLEHA